MEKSHMDHDFLQAATVPPPVTAAPDDPFHMKGDVLSSMDKLTFAASLVALILLILIMALRVKSNIHSYFLSNRSLTFFPMACNMVMSNIGPAQFVGISGFASRSGVTVYAYELNATIALIILGWIFFPVYIASGSMTTIDYLKKRYGSVRMEIYLSVITIVLIISTKASVELYAIYKLLQTIFHKLGATGICLPILIIAVFIPATGGLRSLVYTNTFQAMFLLLGGSFISYFCLNTFQSYIELKEKFYEAWPNTTRYHFGDNSTYKYTTCGIPRTTSWHIVQPYDNLELPWPGMIFGTTIINLWYWCCDQLIVQTGLGGKNIIHCKYACLITGYTKILSLLFLVLPGLVSRIMRTNRVACADPEVCQEMCGLRSGCSNMAFPSIFLDIVPPNYRGFVLVAVLATSISSLASCLNSGSTIFTINMYRNMRPQATELELICMTKMFLVAQALISLLWVRVVEYAPGLYNYIQSMVSTITPPILAIFLCGMLWDRVTEQTAFYCLMGGLAIGFIRLAWEATKDIVPCGEEDISTTPDIIHYFHFLHFAIFLFVLCIVYIVIASIFTEPILMVHLYRLLFWLRHSKLDRVDLAELEAAYETFFADKRIETADINLEELTKEFEDEHKETVEPLRIKICPDEVSALCCMDPMTSNNIISQNELRETSKYEASIKESPGHARSLNIHAVLLMLISAVLWGYFS